jgi:hypothetical protein
LRNFSKAVESQLGAFLGAAGFEHHDRVFSRDRGDGLLNLIAFDNGGRNPKTFRLMLGFNARTLPPPSTGFVHVRYFTGGSLSDSPRDLSCDTPDALRSRLERFRECFDSIVQPFFQSITTKSQLADTLSEQPTLDYVRGLLYFADGDRSRAARELASYLARLKTIEAAPEQVAETIASVKSLLEQCGRPQ